MSNSDTRIPNLTEKDLAASLPDVRSTLSLRGLRAPVSIIRDGWGVPHVRAESEWDAFFAQGFATAQDRLWHMEYDLRRALGRWAEWAGPQALPQDKLWRKLDLENAAKADLDVTGDDAVRMLQAYSAGVNAFIETTKTLPVEYRILDDEPEPWAPWKCLAVYKLRNLPLGVWEMKVWRARLARTIGAEAAAKLFRGYQQGNLLTTPPGDLFEGAELDGLDELIAAIDLAGDLAFGEGGSNAWVIGGALTATGMPIIAGDSHRQLDTPNVYYQVHVACPQWRVSGYALPGTPGAPHFSHTARAAWGMTHGYADYQDLFVEKFSKNDDGGLQYLAEGEWRTASSRVEDIHVRGAGSQQVDVVRTRHGAVIAGNVWEGSGVVFSHPGTNGGTPWANTLLGLLRAKDAEEVEESLRDWTEPVNNFVYADTAGEFGYRYRGRIPIRSISNAWRPVDGSGKEHEWSREIPFEEMPAVRNPATGWVVTCNQRVTGHDYPHYIALDYSPHFRARRVVTRITDMPCGSASADNMQRIHADITSLPGLAFARAAGRLDLPDGPLRAAQQSLINWDGAMEVDSTAAVIYGAARAHWVKALAQHAFGPLADEVVGSARGAPVHLAHLYSRSVAAMEQGDPALLPVDFDLDAAVKDALSAAVEELSGMLGPDMRSWRWGDLHRTEPAHPLSEPFPHLAALLDPPGFEYAGDGETPQAAAYSIVDRFKITTTSSNRYIHDVADWRRSKWVSPLGASGHPGSPHYADQAPLWATVRYVPQLWDWDDVEEAAETTQRIVPAGESGGK